MIADEAENVQKNFPEVKQNHIDNEVENTLVEAQESLFVRRKRVYVIVVVVVVVDDDDVGIGCFEMGR